MIENLLTHPGSTVVLLIGLASLVWCFLGWHQVKMGFRGVISIFQRPIDDRGTGPVFLLPLQTIEQVAVYQQTFNKYLSPPMKTAVVLGEGNQVLVPSVEVSVSVDGAIRVKNAVLGVIALPGKNLASEAFNFLDTAIQAAIETLTVLDLQRAGIRTLLQKRIMRNLRQNPLLAQWDVNFVIEIGDINLPIEYVKAGYIREQANAEAYAIQKKADADAYAKVRDAEAEALAVQHQIGAQGLDLFKDLEGLQTLERMADKGAFKQVTSINLGSSNDRSVGSILSNILSGGNGNGKGGNHV